MFIALTVLYGYQRNMIDVQIVINEQERTQEIIWAVEKE
jgi:hypothetical protein